MPYSDTKNQYCEGFNLVEIWDVDADNNDKYVGLFRIMPRVEDVLGTEASIEYTLEHVLDTLFDDTMIGWHEIGNLGVYTNQVINYILSNQLDTRWILTQCDYSHQYLYGWQDENLLSALYSVVKPFSETDYYWDFNTQTFPWELKLVKANTTPVTDIRYRRNLLGMTRTIDPTNLTTRLYCYGYGEGDNKLNINEVNGGIPYIDSPNIAKYGIITQIWTDERFTIAENLKATGEAMLKQLEEPAISYELSIQTLNDAANLNIGDTVRFIHDRSDEYMIVNKISKQDVSGQPKMGTILLGANTLDAADSMASLADKQRISDTYSQGAESIFMDSFWDNADFDNPLETSFTIPDNAVHVNEIRFSAKLTRFRAYSKATEGGGKIEKTTEDGGARIVTSEYSGGNEYTSSSGGSSVETTSSGGNDYATTSSYSFDQITSDSSNSDDGGGTNVYYGSTNSTTWDSSIMAKYTWSESGYVFRDNVVRPNPLQPSVANHTHELYGHSHNMNHSHTMLLGTSHTHTVNIPSHSHSISVGSHSHTVNIPSHTHTVNIPSHTHNVDIPDHQHEFTLPDHIHTIEYGIHQGSSASAMMIFLDDTFVGLYENSVTDINLIPYMSKNANGTVMRGSHTIQIVPNDLTRIEGTFQIRMFTNAHSGTQY